MNRQRGSRPLGPSCQTGDRLCSAASILTILLLPVIAGVAARELFLGRPVFFLQNGGARRVIFTIWKFRTMTTATGDGRPLPMPNA